MGQSNMAAGATIGSNHNSRANDGEIVAGRGFWPGLSVSLKHNSKFASFTLIAKGSYPAELDIPFPFSLISNNVTDNELTIYPGYWFQHNMYALGRNSWKFENRDNRPNKEIDLEFGYMAPDTVHEIVQAISILQEVDTDGYLPATSFPIENSKRKIKVLRAEQAIAHYKNQLARYACLIFAKENLKEEDLKDLQNPKHPMHSWVNLGGQLVTQHDYTALKQDIKNGTLCTWADIQTRRSMLAKATVKNKCIQALWALEELGLISNTITSSELRQLITQAKITISQNHEKVRSSRAKDFTNHFRKITTKDDGEFEAIYGNLDGNSFLIAHEIITKAKLGTITNYNLLTKPI